MITTGPNDRGSLENKCKSGSFLDFGDWGMLALFSVISVRFFHVLICGSNLTNDPHSFRLIDESNQLTDFARGVLSGTQGLGILDMIVSLSRLESTNLGKIVKRKSVSTRDSGHICWLNARKRIS